MLQNASSLPRSAALTGFTLVGVRKWITCAHRIPEVDDGGKSTSGSSPISNRDVGNGLLRVSGCIRIANDIIHSLQVVEERS